MSETEEERKRREWLATRATPKKRRVRFAFVGGTYAPQKPVYAAQCSGNRVKKRARRDPQK